MLTATKAANEAANILRKSGIPINSDGITVYWDGKTVMVFTGPVLQSGKPSLYKGKDFVQGFLVPA